MNYKYLLFFFAVILMNAMIFSQEIENDNKRPSLKFWLVSSYDQYELNDEQSYNSFMIKNARIIANHQTDPNLSFHIMGEMIGSDKRPLLMQAWIQFKASKYLSFRMGQFKYPIGAEAYGPLTVWKFANPSYVTEGIIKKLGRQGSMFRDIGLEAAGKVPLSSSLSVAFKVMLMNGSGANNYDNDKNKNVVGFLGLNISKNIQIGSSYYVGSIIDSEKKLDESAFGLQLKIKNKNYLAQAEYLRARHEQAIGIPDFNSAGYYISGAYMLPFNVEIGMRYDTFETESILNANLRKSRTTLSLGYYFDSLNRILFNYEHRNENKDNNYERVLTFQLQAVF
jgi:hypothetical protein